MWWKRFLFLNVRIDSSAGPCTDVESGSFGVMKLESLGNCQLCSQVQKLSVIRRPSRLISVGNSLLLWYERYDFPTANSEFPPITHIAFVRSRSPQKKRAKPVPHLQLTAGRQSFERYGFDKKRKEQSRDVGHSQKIKRARGAGSLAREFVESNKYLLLAILYTTYTQASDSTWKRFYVAMASMWMPYPTGKITFPKKKKKKKRANGLEYDTDGANIGFRGILNRIPPISLGGYSVRL